MPLLRNNKLILVAFIILSFKVYGQDKGQMQKQRNELSAKISLTNQLIKESENQQINSEQSLILLNKQASYRDQLIKSFNQEIRELDRNIKANNQEIESLKEELDELKAEYAHLIQQAYKNRDSYDKLMFIFSASNFNQAYKRVKFIQQYTSYREKQAEAIKLKSEDLIELNESLAVKKQKKQALATEKNKEKKKLNENITISNKTLTSLQQNEKELKKQLKQQVKQREKINKAIDRIIAEEIRKSKDSNSGNFVLTPEAKELSSKFSKNKGKLPWPTEKGIITGTFGVHNHPVLPGIKVENNGIDITTEKGSSVRAVFTGTVSAVLDFQHMGKAVIINHGSYRTVYSNLNDVLVEQGQQIDTRQFIGTVLTNKQTGKTEAHFEILFINNKGAFVKQNPSVWISH
jgi:septal ring factor EnvC (AmiA/AmiB activator)